MRPVDARVTPLRKSGQFVAAPRPELRQPGLEDERGLGVIPAVAAACALVRRPLRRLQAVRRGPRERSALASASQTSSTVARYSTQSTPRFANSVESISSASSCRELSPILCALATCSVSSDSSQTAGTECGSCR